MSKNIEYTKASAPEYDPLFCMLAEALEIECKGRPCSDCRVRPSCLRWFDRLAGTSVKRPLAPSDYDDAKNRIRFLSLFK